MELYLTYVTIATLTILLPGPATLLTVSNSIQWGLFKSFAGILGIAFAVLLMAFVSATSFGIALAGSDLAFSAIKFAGAMYLTYMGIKTLRRDLTDHITMKAEESSCIKIFTEGFLVSLSNPKFVIFFVSIFPQFVNRSTEYMPQINILAVIFSGLVIVIHTIYAAFSSLAKSKFNSKKFDSNFSKISGVIFLVLGLCLALM